MGLFSKNKKNTKNQTTTEIVRPENENVVYRDGVFEAFEDTNDGKKYGRILKFQGEDKVFEMPDQEFEMWRDASQNYGKYRITYERDEEFFIEKAIIEKAESAPVQNSGEEDTTPAETVLSQQKNELVSLVNFYNKAVGSSDFGSALLKDASPAEALSCAAFCERKIAELISKARENKDPAEKITVQIPKALDELCKNAKKFLFEKASKSEKLYAIYSEHTKRPHSAAGCVLVVLDKAFADKAVEDFAKKNQKVYAVEFATTADTSIPPAASRIVSEAVNCGLRGIRFIHEFGLTCLIQLNTDEMIKNHPFPENIRLRSAMSAFFQDLRNGVSPEKLKNPEIFMYECMFKSTLLQPCMKKSPEGSGEVSVSIVKDQNGANLLELFTSVELMERSETYIRFKTEAPESSGYKKWTFDELIAEVLSENTPINGFMIDKDCIPVPFAGATLDKIVKLKEIWDNNGKSFSKNG